MDLKEIAFLNIVNTRSIEKFQNLGSHFWYLDDLKDYEIMTFLLRDILVVLGKGLNCYSEEDEDRIRSFLSKLSSDYYFEEDLFCVSDDCLSNNESILLSVSAFYKCEKALKERDGYEISFTHTAFCILKSIVLSMLSNDFGNTVHVSEGILCLVKYFDAYENILLNQLHVKKSEAVNISIPSYEKLKEVYLAKPDANHLLLGLIDKLDHEIVVEIDDLYSFRETQNCFDILDEWFNDNTVIICRNILYDCYKQEYQSYPELFDENPYDDVEELIYEADDTKKYISGTIRLFGREALTNDDNKLVTSFRYTSSQNATNEEYIIVEKDSEYGWYRKKDMAYFEPQYTEIQSTKKWLKVCKDDYCYIVDYDNNRIKNPFTSFDYFDVLHDYVKIRKNDKYGLATLDGNICIPTLYDEITRCSGWYPSKWDLYFAESIKENKKFCFDNDLNIIMEFPLNTKILSADSSIYEYTLDNGNIGYFDITGKILFPALYPHCEKYKSFYCFGSDDNKNILFTCNNSILNIGSQEFIECNNNLLALADLFSIKLFDTQTATLKCIYYSNHKLDSIENAYDGKDSNVTTYGIIIHTNDKQGVIDLNGKEIIPPTYDFISEFVETFNTKDTCYYSIMNETEDGNRWGLVDINGNIIFDCEFEDEITKNEKGNWIIHKEGCEIEISDGQPINIRSIDQKINWGF